ncbi:MAG: hypothetical protein ABUK20_08155, partial [Anaerolineales bacterium]
PEVSIARRMLSYQMDCPNLLNCFNLFVIFLFLIMIARKSPGNPGRILALQLVISHGQFT